MLMFSDQKLLCVCLVFAFGVVVGVASSFTNGSPYYGVADRTVLSVAMQLVTGIINSLVVWFTVPVALGHLFCRSWVQAAITGGGFMVVAIVSYSVYSSVTETSMFIQVSILGGIIGILDWLTIAVIGGVIGGLTGLIARKQPSILLVLVLASIVELARRGASSWQSSVSVGENVVFIVGAIGVVACVIFTTKRRRGENPAD